MQVHILLWQWSPSNWLTLQKPGALEKCSDTSHPWLFGLSQSELESGNLYFLNVPREPLAVR